MKKFQKIKSSQEGNNDDKSSEKQQKLLQQIPQKLLIRQKEIEEDTKQLFELEQKLEEVQWTTPLLLLPAPLGLSADSMGYVF